MQVTIEIDDNVLREKITELVAKQFLDTYRSESYVVKKTVGEAVKTVIDENRERIVQSAIEKAAGKICWDISHGRYEPVKLYTFPQADPAPPRTGG